MSQYNSKQSRNHSQRRHQSQADESDNWRVRRRDPGDSSDSSNNSSPSTFIKSTRDGPFAPKGHRFTTYNQFNNHFSRGNQGNGIFGPINHYGYPSNGPPTPQLLDPPPRSPPKRGTPFSAFMDRGIERLQEPLYGPQRTVRQEHNQQFLNSNNFNAEISVLNESEKTNQKPHTAMSSVPSQPVKQQPAGSKSESDTLASEDLASTPIKHSLDGDNREEVMHDRNLSQIKKTDNANAINQGSAREQTFKHSIQPEAPLENTARQNQDEGPQSSSPDKNPLKKWAEYAETLQAEEAAKEKFWQDRKALLAKTNGNLSEANPLSNLSPPSSFSIIPTVDLPPHQSEQPRFSGQRINHKQRMDFNGSNNRYNNNRYYTNNASHDENWRRSPQRDRVDNYCHPDDRNSGSRREHFARYLHPDVVESGLQGQTYYQGVLRLVRNPMDAYVTSEDLDHDIFISGTQDRNRALDGDLVAVELLDNVDEIWEQREIREQRRFELRKKMREEEAAEREKARRKENGEEEVDEDDLVPLPFDESIDEETDESDTDDEDDHKPKYCGRVVAIIERSPNTTYSGTIVIQKNKKPLNTNETTGKNDDNDNEDSTNDTSTTATTSIAASEESNSNNSTPLPQKPLRLAWFKPADKRIPFFILKYNDIPAELINDEEYFATHLFEVELRRWQITDRNPIGRFVKEIGPIGTMISEKEALLADSNVITAEFTEPALRCLPLTPWSIPPGEYAERRDLRNERIFSIDPKTAKDLDDALHIKALPDGFYEVGVHIADVSYFLKKGTALDAEARKRGTSTYLVDDVIPMLPPLLCEELCSLNPGVERLAFSVIWKMNKQGNAVETWFGKTIIRSCAKLAYEDAQCVIEGREFGPDVSIHDNHDIHDLYNDILTLHRMAVEMRKQRYEKGSLSLTSVKLQFELDEQGMPLSVSQFHAKEANKLVEEFMLRANISVAQKITELFPTEALLRRHQEPVERRLNRFLKIAEVLGLEFDGSSAGSLQKSFDNISNEDVRHVMLVLAIRTMQKAKYFCAGSMLKEKYRHYALNEPIYTHFTSPIRRYADIIVHRMLHAAISLRYPGGSSPYPKAIVKKFSFNCNAKKEGARNAQDRSQAVYLAHYLHQKEQTDGPTFTKAVVIVVAKRNYEIYVPEYGLEKKVLLDSLPLNSSHFDRHTLALDLFWQRDVPVTMHNEEKIYGRAPRDSSYDSDSSSDDEDEEEKEEEVRDSLQALTLLESKPDRGTVNQDDLIPPIVLEKETCRQQLKMFSSIEVRLQVNITRSPPIINIYPVNPFCDEQPAEEAKSGDNDPQ